MNSVKYPKVSIISINYNGASVTCELLESLKQITYPHIEVIIVDNASKEDPSSILKNHPWIKFIYSESNLGFAGGNNLGIHAASGEYFLLLYNDTEVDAGFLEPIVELMENDKTIGVSSPKIIFQHSPGIIQFAGFNPINPYTGRGTSIGFGQQDVGQYNQSHETSRAHGAAMMVPKKVLEQVGPMWEGFFLYYEELDWAERIRRAGFEVWVAPQARVLHKESLTIDKMGTTKTFYLTRNRILFMRRNFGAWKLGIFYVFLMLVTLPKNSLMYVLKSDFENLRAFWKGVFSNFGFKANHIHTH